MITWKQLSQSVLSGAATQLYAAPAATYATVHAISLWNPTGSAVQVKFYIVPSGGAAADATTVKLATVMAGSDGTVPDLVNHKLQPGMSLWAVGNSVTCTISGAENVPT
jgi:hypothetical protein